VREAAKVMDIDLAGATVAIQGYGNVGQFTHKLAEEMGLRVIAVSDSKGGIYRAGGLDFWTTKEHKRTTGSVVGLPETTSLTNAALLESDVTVLFPAALEGVITAKNANNIQAKIIAELANGPTTPEADKILHANRVFLLPDFLCNAGGVTVSYFEQVQNAYDYYWSRETVYERLDNKMSDAFQAVYRVAQAKKLPNRLAAYLVAVERVAEAAKLRGWV
jgi:glutamate dehydrogenase (NAD(P)+)